MVMRVIFDEIVDQRELTAEEAKELYGWLTEEGQQKIELEWLVYHWNMAQTPSGLPADQIEEWFS
jgi:hypoxanthine phosphoribosyltransferase